MPRTHSARTPLWGLAACLGFGAATSGCVGIIGDPSAPLTIDDGGVLMPPPTDAHALGDAPTVDAPVNTEPPECQTAFEPGPPYLRRLTNGEYARTVRDILGQSTDPTAHFTSDSYNAGFDNNVASLHITERHAEDYLDTAESMAHAVLTTPARRMQVLGCDPATATDRAGCIRSFITSFGRRAWRRPLESAEVTQLVTLASMHAGDTDPYAGVALALEAMLQSPNFLFRVEVGVADPARPGFNRLSGFEMASRLAYLLWGSTPDDMLLDAAQAGHLDTADGIAAMARTMIADPRAREAMQVFYGEWLRLYDLDDASPNPTQFPAWNDALQAAMVEENHRFVDDFIWRDGANFLDLLTARYSFVNAPLATLYGVTPPSGNTWARVDFTDANERGGMLTQGAFLAGHARPDSDSPTRRGRYIREVLLCQDMPAPPPDVPALPPTMPGQSERERLDAHRTNPACAGCHTLMDPVGLGLERYGAIGALQRTDPEGRTLTGAGQLVGFDNPDFTGAIQLAARIRTAPQYPHCVVEKTFRFAFGRTLGGSDACTVARVGQAFSTANYSFRDMVLALTASDSFRYVHPGAPEAGGGM